MKLKFVNTYTKIIVYDKVKLDNYEICPIATITKDGIEYHQRVYLFADKRKIEEAYKKFVEDNFIPITTLDRVAELSRDHKAIYVSLWKRHITAAAMANMSINSIQYYIDEKALFEKQPKT